MKTIKSDNLHRHNLYLDKLVNSPHIPKHPLCVATRKDVLPTLKDTGVATSLEDLPSRPVNKEGGMTQEYLLESRSTAADLARKLLKLETRRFPPSRRYGEKFDSLHKSKKIADEKAEAYFSLRKAEINIGEFVPATSTEEGSFFDEQKVLAATSPSNPRKFKDLPKRPRKIYNKDSLFQCMLDNTPISVEPKHIAPDEFKVLPDKGNTWAAESVMFISQFDGGASGSTFLKHTKR
jgi:hypothetical protein